MVSTSTQSTVRCFVASALLVGSALAAGCGGGDSSPAPSATSGAAGAAASPTPGPKSFAGPGPATFRVRAGKAEGPLDIEMFMPADVHVREGDSIEWTAQGFEGHSITFASDSQLQAVFRGYLQPDPADAEQQIFNPEAAFRAGGDVFAGDGSYTNSGFIGVPAEATYRLTFTKRGVYQYLCLVHPFTMRGTVSVDAAAAPVESPESVTARGEAQLSRYLQVERDALDEATAAERSFPATNGNQVHHIAVGLTTDYGQVAAFVKPVLDVKAGDTVIFENDDRDFHNVVFKGAGELPPGVQILVDPGGRGMNYALDKRSAKAADPPAAGFDETTFLASGSMGVTMPRLTWRLTFEKPGTYIYNCTIHVLAGMAGVINVR